MRERPKTIVESIEQWDKLITDAALEECPPVVQEAYIHYAHTQKAKKQKELASENARTN